MNQKWESLPSWVNPKWISKVQRRTSAWYLQHARALPWRTTSDPFAIWVSEIMLQQTQVATVIPYYAKFLSRFPDVYSLAIADESEVFKHWEGLGYYRRARQLHAAAKKIVEAYSGNFPSAFEEVLDLPGIGKYTAGAICSFAYDQQYPIVEANTQRLYARLCKLDAELSTRSAQKSLWDFAEAILPSKNPGTMNQALIELGSQICLPNNPKCVLCPLKDLCPTHRENLVDRIPRAKTPKNYEDREELVILVRDRRQRWLIRRCEKGERWEGLWDFPRFCITGKSDATLLQQHITLQSMSLLGRSLNLGTRVYSLRHAVTRFRIHLHCHTATWQSVGKLKHDPDNLAWVTKEELSSYALSATGRKISTLIQNSRIKLT